MSEALEQLAGGPVLRVSVAGEEIPVSPIRTVELVAFARAVRPIVSDGVFSGDAVNVPDVVMGLVVEHPEALIQAVSVGVRMPVQWVESLSVPDLISLAGAVIAVNTDFFVRAVMPALSVAIERVTAAMMTGSAPRPG
jgi:hypothetical protein